MYRKPLILWAIIAVLLLNLGFLVKSSRTSWAQGYNLTPVIAVTPDPFVGGMIGQVNKVRTLNDLRQLTGEIPICVSSGCNTITDRKTGNIGLDWAMDYVYENLVSLGYSTESWSWTASGYTGRDLIARKPGVITPTEEVYIVAHVDGVKDSGASYPAADDNASGVVDLLELARILRGYAFNRTIVLLFSTGEEQGTLGVSAYLYHLSPVDLRRIIYAINVDMVGFDGNGDRVMELWHGGEAPSMALTLMMSDTIQAYQLRLNPKQVTGCG